VLRRQSATSLAQKALVAFAHDLVTVREDQQSGLDVSGAQNFLAFAPPADPLLIELVDVDRSHHPYSFKPFRWVRARWGVNIVSGQESPERRNR